MPDGEMTTDIQSEEPSVASPERQSPKSRVVSFRVKPMEFAQLERAMKRGDHESVNSFARTAALDVAARADVGRRELRVLVGQLGKLGGRIDALAGQAEVNGFGEVDVALRATSRDICRVMKTMADLLP